MASQEPSPSRSAWWLPPLQPGRSFALVVERLRGAIEAGELTPGEKLPAEPELASLFGISRSVVREALKILELSGYLEVRRGYGGGTFVCVPKAEEFTTVAPPPIPAVAVSSRQLVEVRLAIEPAAARLAAASAGSDLSGLNATLFEMRTGDDRPGTVLRAAVDFHVEVARISRNPVFVNLLEVLRAASYWAMRDAVMSPEWRVAVRDDHARIAGAIEAGDPADAEELMREHVLSETALQDLAPMPHA